MLFLTAKSTSSGHTIEFAELRGHTMYLDGGQWLYADTKTPTIGHDRPCGYCGKPNTREGHDACLGTLPGVRNACCGHGQEDIAYIQLTNGVHIQGKEAIEVMRKITLKQEVK